MNNSRIAALLGAGILLVVGLLAGVLVVTTGAYNVAADSPHAGLTRALLTFARERSIEEHASVITVPSLANAEMIADGAADYDAMCTSCHLAPGLAENEMRPGMNPMPPLLARLPAGNPAQQFWVIKHGIKMTGMPAWGVTHSDDEIWNMVAFLQKLPKLSPAAYRALTAKALDHHDAMHMDEH